ncbi:MAG: hypothetical protein MJ124_08940 [Lachnospiraceae bacterium]|nr:hypothetical protein [Lachnospiraceae bacterium]
MKSDCYYASYGSCGCSMSPNCNKSCVGKADCELYISEDDYFVRMMNGTLPEIKMPKEDPRKAREEIARKLTPEKSKKQLKYERRQEAKENGGGDGFSLGDDPRFKDIFKK